VTDVTDMTIDELARRVGMTARNVRAHQSRGLIPPPRLQGRTGYYGPEHITRLELIHDLQEQGFNLGSIKRLLANDNSESVGDALDFTRTLTTPFGDERPREVEAGEFMRRWGDQLTPELTNRIQELGFVRDLGGGRFEVRSPRLERASEELEELGVPLSVAVDITGRIRQHAEAVAASFVELFLEQVWRPFEAAGEPAAEWPRVREALERLRPLAGESLMAVFGIVMTDAVELALERELARLAEGEAGAA
jgi:DNA-binding transcriptional MerR regulator